jgi:hypothetical protein
MAWWRSSGLVRAVAVTLLLWTGADLANSNLCALEQEQPAPTSSEDRATQVAAASSLPSQTGESSESHVDDCFCCSHCTKLQVLVIGIAASPVGARVNSLDASSPLSFNKPLDLPPLA